MSKAKDAFNSDFRKYIEEEEWVYDIDRDDFWLCYVTESAKAAARHKISSVLLNSVDEVLKNQTFCAMLRNQIFKQVTPEIIDILNRYNELISQYVAKIRKTSNQHIAAQIKEQQEQIKELSQQIKYQENEIIKLKKQLRNKL